MQVVKFLLSAFITGTICFLLSTGLKIGGKQSPPLGKFLNPFTGFWQNVERTKDFKSSDIHLHHKLKGQVKVVFDDRLVPHIFALDREDALFVQGYVTARFRLWQMDISTRSAGGSLAEIFGEPLLERDKLQRRKGMLWAAEKTVEQWKKNEDGFRLILAYVEGVNAYLKTLKPKDYPLEFKLFDYRPQEWTPLKCALFYKSMEETLNSREEDLEATNSLAIFGKETFDFLFPEQSENPSPVIPEGTPWNFEPLKLYPEPGTDSILSKYEYVPLEKTAEGIGSNNWAVAAWKTKNGNPILCNDPHLKLTLPSIWFEVQLKTKDANVYGVSFPGIPGVMIGFNEHCAFGTTNGSQDVLDWYEIDWVDQSKTAYFLDGISKPIEKRVETIFVKGQKNPVFDTVKYTFWGPIVYEKENSPHKDLAMRWISHDTGDDFIWRTFWGFNRANTFDDYLEATSYFGHPIQNFVFANTNGDIALKVTGDLPLKMPEQGRFVQRGNTIDNAWKGLVPDEQMPLSLNPPRGFVSSANQISTDASYPYYYNGEFDVYRSSIINRRLDSMQAITVEDMMRLQTNNYSIFAETALPLFFQHLDKSALNTVQIGILKILEDWNLEYNATDVAPAIFQEWYGQFYDLMWDEFDVYADSLPVLQPKNWRTLQLLKDHPTTVYFDIKSTPEREGPTQIITQSFINTVDSLQSKLSDTSFNWASYKSTAINHMARIDAFSKKKVPVGGFKYAINAVSEINGPSWRMVVELGKEVKGWGVYPGGQSGNPGSRFYDNMIDQWSEGKYNELFFMKDVDDRSKPILFSQTFD